MNALTLDPTTPVDEAQDAHVTGYATDPNGGGITVEIKWSDRGTWESVALNPHPTLQGAWSFDIVRHFDDDFPTTAPEA